MLKKQIFFVQVVLMMSVAKSFAQDPIDGPEGPPASPLNDYTLPLMCVAILLGGYLLFKVKKK